MARPPKITDPTQQFFSRLFENPKAQGILETILDTATKTGFPLPIQILYDQQQQELDKIKEKLRTTPLGEEGRWMSVQDIFKLNLGYSTADIETVMREHADDFSKKPHSSEQKFWVDHTNIKFLHKKTGATSAYVYASTMQEYARANAEVVSLRRRMETLEKRFGTTEAQMSPQETETPGIWMTGKQIHDAGSKYDPVYIGQLVKKVGIPYQKRPTKGRAIEAKITAQNYHIVGLEEFPPKGRSVPLVKPTLTDPEPIVPTRQNAPTTQTPIPSRIERVEPKPALQQPTQAENPNLYLVSGKPYEVKPSELYGPEFAAEILRQIHPATFSPDVIELILDSSIKEGQIPGKEIQKLLKRFNGLMDPSSTTTQKALEEALGVPMEQVPAVLKHEKIAPFVHNLYGKDDGPIYFLKDELPKMKLTWDLVSDKRDQTRRREHLPPVQPVHAYAQPENTQRTIENKKQELLSYYSAEFKRRRIRIPDKVYETLTTSRMLDTINPEEITSTFRKFMGVMENYEFMGLDQVARAAGFEGYREFAQFKIPELIEMGMLVDLTTLIPPRKPCDRQLYVVARNKKQEMYEHLGIVPGTPAPGNP